MVHKKPINQLITLSSNLRKKKKKFKKRSDHKSFSLLPCKLHVRFCFALFITPSPSSVLPPLHHHLISTLHFPHTPHTNLPLLLIHLFNFINWLPHCYLLSASCILFYKSRKNEKTRRKIKITTLFRQWAVVWLYYTDEKKEKAMYNERK